MKSRASASPIASVASLSQESARAGAARFFGIVGIGRIIAAHAVRRLSPSFGPLPLFLVAVVGILGAVAVMADTLWLIVRYFQPLFFWDPWGTVEQYERFLKGNYGISDLFAQHNEHRIVFPRFIFLLDFELGKGLNIINIIFIMLIQLAHAIILSRFELEFNKNAIAAISISVVFILLFSYGQSENFTWGFQVQFVGVYAAATTAFWWFSIAKFSRRINTSYYLLILGAFLMTFVATYTMANGFVSAFTLIALALLLRFDKKIIFSAVLVAIALAASYFYNFEVGGDHSPSEFVLAHPLDVLIYLFLYIGGPMGPFGFAAAGVMGAVGLAMTVFAVMRMIWRPEQVAARAALVGVMLFVVATAGVTAYGRAFLGPDTALASRYLTPACIFWAAQVVYWSSFAQLRPRNWPALGIFATVSVVVVTGAVRAHFEASPYAQESFRNLNLASDALLSGGDLPDALELIYFDSDLPARLARFLDQQHLSIFSWPEARLRGKSLREAFATIDDGACFGSFDALATPPESIGAAAEGWAWDRVRRKPVNRIILIDSKDVVVGFASGGWRRADVREAVSQVRSKDVGWQGFAKLSDGEPLRAYADLDGGRVACKLGEHAAPENANRIGDRPRDADLSGLGPPIPAKHALSGGWTLNGQDPSAGVPALSGAFYGSRSGAESDQGEALIGPFQAPAGTFALPIVTSAATTGLSITIKDAETGEIYVSLRPRARPHWRAAIFSLPPERASRPLMLVAADRRAGAGQWMAIGDPHLAER